PNLTNRWLDAEFFRAAGELYCQSLRRVDEPEIRLLYFARGAQFLGRRLGFIPGRSAGMVGCIFAWREGIRLELKDIFEEVYRVPKTRWAPYVKFSGGSRLDSEFLVTLDKQFESKLREYVGAAGVGPTSS